MALHAEDTGHVVQLLGHVLTNAFQLAAALAGRGIGFVTNLAAWEIGRQGLTFGLLLGLRCRGLLGIECIYGIGHGGQVGVNLVFEQAALFGVEALGLGRKLHAFEQCVLVAELLQQSTLVAQLSHQPRRHLAQLFCAQFVQGMLIYHHGRYCASTAAHPPLAHLPIGNRCQCLRRSHHGNDTCLTHTLPRQAQYQRIKLDPLQAAVGVAIGSPDKLALMQPACCQPDANAVMHQDLEPVGSLVGKHIGVVRLGSTEDGDHTGQC